MAFLTAISGSSYGKRFELTKKSTVMGRHPDCDVVIEAGAVSRQHASIEMVGDDYLLQDLKSRNGTFLNGHLVDKPSPLHDGDLIRICDVEYSFHNPALQGSSELMLDSANLGSKLGSGFVSGSGSGFGSGVGVMLIDEVEEAKHQRAIQSKLDFRGSTHGTQLVSTAESRLQAVLDITQNLGHAVSLEDVLPKVLDTLFRVFLQADRAFIVLVEDGELIPKWVKTRNPDHQEDFRISRTVMREVMQSKEAIISLDASSDERFGLAQSISAFSIRSMIVAPLLDSQGEAIGAIQMDSLDTSRRFEKGDLEILASIAVQAGIAIENAQLHEVMIERNRVEQDLELARQVQRAFLPADVPRVEGYHFFDFYRPAEQVGGDYFGYIRLENNRLAIVVADVVGHGVAAAMLMAKLSAEVSYCLASHEDLAQAVSMLNQRIQALNLQRFITILCLRLNLADGKVDLVNAGHMSPIWMRRSRDLVEEPGEEEAGIPLGVMDDYQYQALTIDLEPGDELMVYTDGISEAPDTAGALYGIQRLRRHASTSNGNIDELGQAIVQDVSQYTKDTRQADDMCLVLIKRLT